MGTFAYASTPTAIAIATAASYSFRFAAGGPRVLTDKYTDKQKRQAEHIEEGYEKRGVPEEEAERRAWATVNKVQIARNAC